LEQAAQVAPQAVAGLAATIPRLQDQQAFLQQVAAEVEVHLDQARLLPWPQEERKAAAGIRAFQDFVYPELRLCLDQAQELLVGEALAMLDQVQVPEVLVAKLDQVALER
jgi:hypothetical protein